MRRTTNAQSTTSSAARSLDKTKRAEAHSAAEEGCRRQPWVCVVQKYGLRTRRESRGAAEAHSAAKDWYRRKSVEMLWQEKRKKKKKLPLVSKLYLCTTIKLSARRKPNFLVRVFNFKIWGQIVQEYRTVNPSWVRNMRQWGATWLEWKMSTGWTKNSGGSHFQRWVEGSIPYLIRTMKGGGCNPKVDAPQKKVEVLHRETTKNKVRRKQ